MTFNQIIMIIITTLVPIFELRASIPLGILRYNLPWHVVFITAVITNIILGFLVFFFLDEIMRLVLRFKAIRRLYDKFVLRTQHKIQKKVDKYGWIGVAIFIGIPLPFSGVYTGALGAYLIGVDYKKFIIANIFGVLMAGILVTLFVLFGDGMFNMFFNPALVK